MRVLVSADAEDDLVDGARFYDSIEPGLGVRFIDSLLSDIDSLHSYAGIHTKLWGYYRLLSQRLPYACTTRCRTTCCVYMPCSIAVRTRRRHRNAYNRNLRRICKTYRVRDRRGGEAGPAQRAGRNPRRARPCPPAAGRGTPTLCVLALFSREHP